MPAYLTNEQSGRLAQFREFTASHVAPFAADWDAAQRIPASVFSELGRAGCLGPTIPERYGGQGWDTVSFGLLHQALGRGDSALTDLVTVQAMVGMALLKWGTEEQRRRWLPPLAGGETIGAFALTEPEAGSDFQAATTEFKRDGSGGRLILNGEKKWISGAQVAGLFLVFGQLDRKPVACLVPRESDGFELEPIKDLLGFRAAGLARLRFHDVAVPAANVIGQPGFAFSHVAPVGLHYGRIGTACSAAGLLRGCLEESAGYAAARKLGDQRVADRGMIQSMFARMGADLEAAELLCWSACRSEDDHLPEAFNQALIAKYFSSRAAVRAAADAVQIHGAAGCHESAPVARFYRGAKIMEIIEGTTQVHEMLLGQSFVQDAVQRRRAIAVEQRNQLGASV